MAGKRKTDKELWQALERLDDDLIDPDLPDSVLDDELRAMGLDGEELANRGIEFVTRVKEEQRLSWQTRARERRALLERRASKARIPAEMDRQAMLALLEQLRANDPEVGTAISMAARKRKPEQSSDDELRVLVEEMLTLRAIEDDDPE